MRTFLGAESRQHWDYAPLLELVTFWRSRDWRFDWRLARISLTIEKQARSA